MIASRNVGIALNDPGSPVEIGWYVRQEGFDDVAVVFAITTNPNVPKSTLAVVTLSE